jgi:calpain family cysteine protease
MSFARKKARPPRASTARFTPGVERLETRDVPATASLMAGVLTVNGTTGNDSIVLRQANGRVSIDGLTKTFAATSVNSVVVNAGAGNDTVSVSRLKAQPWTKAVTVRSASGNDSVRLLDGRNVYISGSNQTLFTSSAGTTTLNGRALDWFDCNVRDAALRQLLRTDYADAVVNRGEMLGVFHQVEHDGTVSTNEFNDLKAVANNGWLLGWSSYTTDLTRNVVMGNAANAHFQGTTLGNLAAGSNAAKLDKLVDKWFLGADRPAASYPGLTVTYTTAAGTLFGSAGPQYTDVHQGAVGDCYFVATLGEIALRSPAAIQNVFIVNGDGTYGVRFYQYGASRWVTVDSKLPTYSGGWFLYANMGGYAGNSSNVLWVALAEKAYAQLNESGWLRPASWGGGQNSYRGIEGGLFADAAAQVINHASTYYDVSGASDDPSLANAVTTGQLIGFASTSSPTDSRVVGNHQYIVIGYNSSTKTVTLFNPWGINNGSPYPGLLNLNLSQLTGNFDYWTVA